MKSKYFLSVIAVLFALALSAFTLPKKSPVNHFLTGTQVWFEVDNNGDPIDDQNGQTGTNPFNCPNTSSDLCARALTYDSGDEEASEVILNEDEVTYSIKPGVDISSPSYYDATLYKNTP